MNGIKVGYFFGVLEVPIKLNVENNMMLQTIHLATTKKVLSVIDENISSSRYQDLARRR